MKLTRLTLVINGVERPVLCDPEKDNLAVAIRRMGLTGTKIGCGTGVCGACSVILNGKVVRSCTRKMKSVPEFSEITLSRALALLSIYIRCSRHGLLTAAHNAVSVLPVSSYPLTSCWPKIPPLPAKMFVSGSERTETSAAVPAISLSLTPSWLRQR